MNPNNYASLEASKRLAEAGIVLETEAGWYKIYRPGCHSFDMVRSLRSGNEKFYGDNFPAPSMTEVWRELPEEIMEDDSLFCVKSGGKTLCYYHGKMQFSCFNPTDALIDLLIWVKKEASHE